MRLCQRMCGNDRVFTVVGGLLFLVSPAVTWRVFGHFALASHWLLVASLACYVRPTAGMAPRRWLAPFALIAVIGGGIHPYLAVLRPRTRSRELRGPGLGPLLPQFAGPDQPDAGGLALPPRPAPGHPGTVRGL
jgi:hypothetical protein